ncbi:hypothetical protein E2562_012592 [Oryza meyeriana var. granulata]|uniref:Uncharacterized protein n=1 Tax=Oryza meyeriana var. granulata TaxID=110450 RepID=A0A6G1D374_9ORYZ|nr:hypothetical protein E2562_012592 [Oryza meyeriana var. granulata]
MAALFKWMHAHAMDSPPNLLTDERDDLLLLQVSLRRIPASPSTKPCLLPLPHLVLPGESASICVISDRPKSRSPAASDLLNASRRNFDEATTENEQWFPMVTWTKYERGDLIDAVVNLRGEICSSSDDKAVATVAVDEQQCKEAVERLYQVAFWCVQ